MGESKKKGIAITTITGLLAYQPKTWIEVIVAVLVVAVAVYAINRQASLDKEKKNG